MEGKFQHSPKWNGEYSRRNVIFFIVTPLLAIGLLPYFIFWYGLAWSDLAIGVFMYFAASLGITVGYHRMYSHQAFEAPTWVRAIMLFFGSAAVQESALKWGSDHRYHHRFVDHDGDPYNINRGFYHAHIGWIFFKDPAERTLDNAPDLVKDPLIQFQHKHYVLSVAIACFVFPMLLGALVGRPLAGLFWGGLFRMVLLQHTTFLINSAAHMFGNRPYSTKVTARDCWWMALLTNGEGYHNFHHAFGSDYRNGLLWYQWDPSKWIIALLEKAGLARNVRRTPEAIILKARFEASFEEFRSSWTQNEIPDQLEQIRASLEAKLHEFQVKLREFQTWKESKVAEHARFRRSRARYWKRRLRNERLALEASVAEFRELLRATKHLGAVPSLA